MTLYLFFLAHRIRGNDVENHELSNFHCLNVNTVIIILQVNAQNLENKILKKITHNPTNH